ncbi:MAG: EF-P beta-lysylation protein EpmB [Xanthomonadaceae bacterium]|nr:EF-P beta-lysylation protein EpmB [Xanthomonadaceae bacterium]
MIPVSDAAWQTPRWQSELADAITDPAELLALLDLDAALLPAALQSAAAFPLRVPRGFVARMRTGDPHDPLLRQVLPIADELATIPGYVEDPLEETAELPDDGVLRKYDGRALVVTTGACGVHCRYCFRRHFPYSDTRAASDGWQPVLARFAADPSLAEAILSGGDPLTLSDRRLALLVEGLGAVPHLRRLRIHTRQPVVLPTRIDGQLLRWLRATRLETVVVIHANHPAEIDQAVRDALAALRDAGATLLNQSVLLRGVNDSVPVLAELSEALFGAGVLPYYLHLLDPVAGAAHFDLPLSTAHALHGGLQRRLPGYLVPRLVREVAGEPMKTPVYA